MSNDPDLYHYDPDLYHNDPYLYDPDLYHNDPYLYDPDLYHNDPYLHDPYLYQRVNNDPDLYHNDPYLYHNDSYLYDPDLYHYDPYLYQRVMTLLVSRESCRSCHVRASPKSASLTVPKLSMRMLEACTEDTGHGGGFFADTAEEMHRPHVKKSKVTVLSIRMVKEAGIEGVAVNTWRNTGNLETLRFTCQSLCQNCQN